MWTRNEAQPCKYTGILFRSGLEAKVAEALDALGLEADWAYEREVPGITTYLPDFTIERRWATSVMRLPHWLEVKPAELLYATRDHFGCPERFTDDETHYCTAEDLRKNGLTEIWKPKRLAEWAGEPVLVVSVLNRNRSLSIEMHPEHLVLSRSHPAVNWRQVLHDLEMEERRLRWERQRWIEAIDREEADLERRWALVNEARASQQRPARYDGECRTCLEWRTADQLTIFWYEHRWQPICTHHLQYGP